MYEAVNVTGLDGYTNYSLSIQADNRRTDDGGLSDFSHPVEVFTEIGSK